MLIGFIKAITEYAALDRKYRALLDKHSALIHRHTEALKDRDDKLFELSHQLSQADNRIKILEDYIAELEGRIGAPSKADAVYVLTRKITDDLRKVIRIMDNNESSHKPGARQAARIEMVREALA